MFPSLVNCTTIDWFTEWPHDALEKVASKFLEDMDMDDEVRIHSLLFLFVINSHLVFCELKRY
jgi:hypothetical protein